MKKMSMEDWEILQNWNNRSNSPEEQIRVLADLNGVGPGLMREKLAELGAEHVPDTRKAKRNGKPRKFDPVEALRRYTEGQDDGQIAEALGVGKTTVAAWRNEEGLVAQRYRNSAVGNKEEVLKLYRAGRTDKEIAEKLKISRESVTNWRCGMGLECNRQRKEKRKVETPGEARGKAEKNTCADDAVLPSSIGQDRTGGDPVGKEAPVEKQACMGVEGLLRITQRMQEAFPQAVLTAGGRYVRDVRVHIFYGADGEVGSAEMELMLEEVL